MRLIRLYLLSFIIICSNVFAAKTSISKLKDRIANQRSSINLMAAEIRDIDNKIAQNNEEYLNRINEIEKIENKVDLLKENLSKSAKEISEEYKLSKKAFDMYLLEVSDKENENQIEYNMIYKEILKKKLLTLKNAHKNSQSLLKSINEYEQHVIEKKKDEESIYSFIMDLEAKKKEISQKYITLKENSDLNQSTLEKALIKLKAKKKVTTVNTKSVQNLIDKIKIGLPLQKFQTMSEGQKGITFKFNEAAPVLSPATGKIVYAGELASYGKVIMVDHGEDVRSVLLGDMVVKASKGDMIHQGDIIGYTVADPAVLNTLYFEIRKKNIAQNTGRWISAKSKINI